MESARFVLAACMLSVGCAHTVRLPPAELVNACEEGAPCADVPYPAHGLEWDEVYVETEDGTRTHLSPDELAMDRLVAPEVECVEFRRDTTHSTMAGVLLGSIVGVFAGGYLGGASVPDPPPDATLLTYRGYFDGLIATLYGGVIGLVSGGALGGRIAHKVGAGNSYPSNACR